MRDFLRKIATGAAVVAGSLALGVGIAYAAAFIVPQGGTGATTFTQGGVLQGNGSNPITAISPGTSGNVLTSNGSIWASAAVSGDGSFSTTSAAYWLTTKTTADLTELTNLYFTTARAITALTGQNISIFTNNSGYITGNQSITLSGDISGSGTTGITTAIGSNKVTVGMLATAAANTVLGNPTGATGNVQAIATSSLFKTASASVSGLLSSTDWSTFNAKGSGTVTAVSCVSSNGFNCSSGGGATPALTFTTTITGLLKGNGTAISAAALTDFPAQAANTVIANGTGASAVPTAVATSSLFQNSSASVTGLLSSTDWSTFNSKVGTSRAITIAGTAAQITSSAGSQDLSSDRTWTLSIPSLFRIQQASTTDFSANTAAVGGTATTSISSAGVITTPSIVAVAGRISGISGVAGNCLHVDTNGVISGTGTDCGSAVGTVTSVSGTALQITSSGGTTPVLSLPSLVVFPGNASTTQLSVTGKAYFGGTATSTFDSTGALTLTSALTYGGVTLSNAVTGTGNMVLSATPTFTGTAGFANATFSGTTVHTGLATFGLASSSQLSVGNKLFVGGTSTTTIDSVGNISLPSAASVTQTNLATAAGTFVAADATGKLIATTSPSATPGGSTKQIQFNNAGAFAGAASAFWDSVTGFLGLGTSTPTAMLQIANNSPVSYTKSLDIQVATSSYNLTTVSTTTISATGAGTWTVPANLVSIKVIVIGGGGGASNSGGGNASTGGGSTNFGNTAGYRVDAGGGGSGGNRAGGGGGGLAIKTIAAGTLPAAGQTVAYTVGQNGTNGGAGFHNGGAGVTFGGGHQTGGYGGGGGGGDTTDGQQGGSATPPAPRKGGTNTGGGGGSSHNDTSGVAGGDSGDGVNVGGAAGGANGGGIMSGGGSPGDNNNGGGGGGGGKGSNGDTNLTGGGGGAGSSSGAGGGVAAASGQVAGAPSTTNGGAPNGGDGNTSAGATGGMTAFGVGSNGSTNAVGGDGAILIVTTVTVAPVLSTATTTAFTVGFLTATSTDGANGTTTPAVGVGTSTPSATFAVQSFTGTITAMFAGFQNAVKYIYFEIDQWGHKLTGGGAPTCGTGCASVVGDDTNMRVVTGSTISAATVNFNHTYTTTPVCIATEESAGVVVADASSTPTTVVLNFASALTAMRIAVHCENSLNFTY